MMTSLGLLPEMGRLHETRKLGFHAQPHVLSFFLNCVLTAQMRARHTSRGFAYKAAAQKRNEATIEALLLPHVPDTPLDGAIGLFFTAFFPPPKSVSPAPILREKFRHVMAPNGNLGAGPSSSKTR